MHYIATIAVCMFTRCRLGGASAIAITTDKNSGGCSTQDVVNVVKEQATAMNDFPSPLPVIVRDLLVDEFQIALAKVRAVVPNSYAVFGAYARLYAMCYKGVHAVVLRVHCEASQ
jgi:hypothetical protein